MRRGAGRRGGGQTETHYPCPMPHFGDSCLSHAGTGKRLTKRYFRWILPAE